MYILSIDQILSLSLYIFYPLYFSNIKGRGVLFALKLSSCSCPLSPTQTNALLSGSPNFLTRWVV